MSAIKTGVVNPYVVMPKNLTEYTAFRGVTDFTQIGQFNQFETGYSFLSVISMPRYITKIAEKNAAIKQLSNSFKHMLEFEFRGLTGLPDIQGNPGTITDGINELNYINRVTMDTSITVSIPYFEKTGSLITKFSEYYLTGIKDRLSQAKTYHGLIRNGDLEPGLENEVFTLMYYVTDATMLRLERAVLLANAQIVNAETSMYDSNRSDINNHEITLQFNCFPIMGEQVDKAASVLLRDITGVAAQYSDNNPTTNITYSEDPDAYEGLDRGDTDHPSRYVAHLDSNDYLYGIMDKNRNSTANIRNPILTNAIDGVASTGNSSAEYSQAEKSVWGSSDEWT